MKCPICSHENTKVIESRLSHEGRSVRRRRSCLSCNHRYTTYEKEEELVFQVRKKDGRFEPFSREKVLQGLHVACQKRRISVQELDEMVARIERNLQEEGERAVDSERVGDLVMEQLRELDHVAYVRFASVYKDFKDPEEFLAELKTLKPRTKPIDSTTTSRL